MCVAGAGGAHSTIGGLRTCVLRNVLSVGIATYGPRNPDPPTLATRGSLLRGAWEPRQQTAPQEPKNVPVVCPQPWRAPPTPTAPSTHEARLPRHPARPPTPARRLGAPAPTPCIAVFNRTVLQYARACVRGIAPLAAQHNSLVHHQNSGPSVTAQGPKAGPTSMPLPRHPHTLHIPQIT